MRKKILIFVEKIHELWKLIVTSKISRIRFWRADHNTIKNIVLVFNHSILSISSVANVFIRSSFYSKFHRLHHKNIPSQPMSFWNLEPNRAPIIKNLQSSYFDVWLLNIDPIISNMLSICFFDFQFLSSNPTVRKSRYTSFSPIFRSDFGMFPFHA